MSELKQKAVKGISWSFIDNIAGSGITFIVGIFLARLLSAAEFGVIGIVIIFIAVSNSLVDSGFSNALIRKKDIASKDYNTVFYFNLAVSFFLYGVLFLSSTLIADYFHLPILVEVLRVIGFVLPINAFAIIQRTILVKRVDFKTQAKVSIISSVISGGIAIGMAYSGYGVWSLVGLQISKQLLNTVFLWYFNTWRPKLEYCWKSFRELFSFGSKLLVSGLLDTIYNNIYQLVIGRYYSATQLGYYTRSQQFQMVFSSNLTAVIQRVSYPIFSEIQDDSEKLFTTYRKTIKTTMMITFALMLGLMAIAKPLIVNLIGEKWIPSVYYLQIICFTGMLYPLHAINLNILQVRGRSDLYLKLEVIKKIIGVLPIVVGVIYGIEYMLWSSVLIGLVAYILNSYYSKRLVGYSTLMQVKDILPSFVISLSISLFLLLIVRWFGDALWVLISQIVLGGLFTCLVYHFFKNEEFIEIKGVILSYLKKK